MSGWGSQGQIWAAALAATQPLQQQRQRQQQRGLLALDAPGKRPEELQVQLRPVLSLFSVLKLKCVLSVAQLPSVPSVPSVAQDEPGIGGGTQSGARRALGTAPPLDGTVATMTMQVSLLVCVVGSGLHPFESSAERDCAASCLCHSQTTVTGSRHGQPSRVQKHESACFNCMRMVADYPQLQVSVCWSAR